MSIGTGTTESGGEGEEENRESKAVKHFEGGLGGYLQKGRKGSGMKGEMGL